jgi:hypothetical protein
MREKRRSHPRTKALRFPACVVKLIGKIEKETSRHVLATLQETFS